MINTRVEAGLREGFCRMRRISLQYKVMLLNITMIFMVFIMVGILVINILIRQVQEDAGEQAMVIGRIVAQTPAVQDAILSDNPSVVLQPLAERWRKSSDSAFVIIANMDQVRLSHPISSNVGTPLADLYRQPVLRGEEYVYIAQGSLPLSIRANVPIFAQGNNTQIGFVSVGFYLDNVYRDAMQKFIPMLYLFLVAIIISIIGSVFIARNIKKSILGLEPHEIATIVKEKQATLEAIREGVISVDKKGIIRLLNSEAASILGITPESASKCHIDAILPQNSVDVVIHHGKSVYDEEQKVNDIIILSNSVPITVDDKVVGAVISFRDRTEIHRLAEELTGVHKFVDILRAQAHEFKNKIHTVAGLIQLQRYDEAVNFMIDNGSEKQELVDYINERVQDPTVCGLLIGKVSHMRELGINFTIAPETILSELPGNTTSGDLVLIIGNFLQNAIDANAGGEKKWIDVSIVQYDDVLEIRVRNAGTWISEEVAEQIYQRGFTTKDGNSGLGLALISEKLKLVSGEITHRNLPGGGVEFIVWLPY